jgi:hypothetical protein
MTEQCIYLTKPRSSEINALGFVKPLSAQAMSKDSDIALESLDEVSSARPQENRENVKTGQLHLLVSR